MPAQRRRLRESRSESSLLVGSMIRANANDNARNAEFPPVAS
jgi:hypothetical protein